MSSLTNAIVLFSGGQDSSVCLAHALSKYAHVETIGFDYGQRHSVELTCRESVRNRLRELNSDWSDRLGNDYVLDAAVLKSLGENSHDARHSDHHNGGRLAQHVCPGPQLTVLNHRWRARI